MEGEVVDIHEDICEELCTKFEYTYHERLGTLKFYLTGSGKIDTLKNINEKSRCKNAPEGAGPGWVL